MAEVVDRDVADLLRAQLQELFAAHVDAVFNVAYRVLWNRADAEDVVQATFVKVFMRLDQLKDSGRAKPWILQIAYREAIAVIRKRKDVPTDPADMTHTVSSDDGPAEQAVLSDIVDHLSAALERLDDDERMAVILRDVEQLPMRDVASVLEVGLSAAKMRVHRGRQSLRVILEAQEIRP